MKFIAVRRGLRAGQRASAFIHFAIDFIEILQLVWPAMPSCTNKAPNP